MSDFCWLVLTHLGLFLTRVDSCWLVSDSCWLLLICVGLALTCVGTQVFFLVFSCAYFFIIKWWNYIKTFALYEKAVLLSTFSSHMDVIIVLKIQWKYLQSIEMYFYGRFQTDTCSSWFQAVLTFSHLLRRRN